MDSRIKNIGFSGMYDVNDIKSYDITGKGFDPRIEQLVRVCHMNYLRYINRLILKKHNFHIYVSLKSSWRPKWWEKAKGRSGSSTHTYNFMGATDITCVDFPDRWEIILKYLTEHTCYTRMAIYHTVRKDGVKSGFIHVDYKNKYDNRWVYEVKNGIWNKKHKIKWPRTSDSYLSESP